VARGHDKILQNQRSTAQVCIVYVNVRLPRKLTQGGVNSADDLLFDTIAQFSGVDCYLTFLE